MNKGLNILAAIFISVTGAAVAAAIPSFDAYSESPAMHTAGQCAADLPEDRCEVWAKTYDDASIKAPSRSDQFVTGTAVSSDSVFVSLKSVALNPDDPYSASGSWQVLAYDAATGAQRWLASRRTRVYDSPLDIAVSPDGTRVFVTGAAYDAFPVGATDSRLVTVAYDAGTGEELWSAQWDGRPDGIDNGLAVTTNADGSEVYIGGITTVTGGDLDYIVLAYRAGNGRRMWETTYAGARAGGSDALKDIAVSPDGALVYVTGESEGVVREYDNDYLTLALRTRGGKRGSIAWEARYDGVGDGRSDRAKALAVAPDGTVLVTGDSAALEFDGSTRFDAATVAYTPAGDLRWEARLVGPFGLEFGTGVAVGGDAVAVTSLGRGADAQSGQDTTTVVYDLATGQQRWTHRAQDTLSSEVPNGGGVFVDSSFVYTLSSERPTIQYTSLYEMVLRVHHVSSGAAAWSTRLDAGSGNAVSSRSLSVMPDGRVAVAGEITLSQNPLGPPSQNRYDALTALIAPR